MSYGDYIRVRRDNIPVNAQAVITATAQAATTAVAVRSANHRIYVQKITLSITTHAAGKVFTVQPHTTTTQVVANRSDLAAAAGVPDVITWDFGPEGWGIPKGENLDWLWSTGDSGFVGVAKLEGYQRLEGAVAIAAVGATTN